MHATSQPRCTLFLGSQPEWLSCPTTVRSHMNRLGRRLPSEVLSTRTTVHTPSVTTTGSGPGLSTRLRQRVAQHGRVRSLSQLQCSLCPLLLCRTNIRAHCLAAFFYGTDIGGRESDSDSDWDGHTTWVKKPVCEFAATWSSFSLFQVASSSRAQHRELTVIKSAPPTHQRQRRL